MWSNCTSGGSYVGVDISDAGVRPDGSKVPGFKYYPAAFAEELDCVLAVSAVGSTEDRLPYWSNYGAAVKIAAPGENIWSDHWESQGNSDPWASDIKSGTSMATPHVMGAALLLRNAFPWATRAQVLECITSMSTDPVRPAAYYGDNTASVGGGVLKVDAAYDCLAAKQQYTANISCVGTVNFTMQYPSCQKFTVPVSALYTVVSGAPVVTASQIGPYGPGRTTVTLIADGGVTTCTTEVIILPCAVKCKAASVTADAATCQAPQSAIANMVDKISIGPGGSLAYSPVAPFPIGRTLVNFTVKYPGGVTSAPSASCMLTVVAPTGSSSIWTVKGKSMCMYRSAATTQEYCFIASQLITITTSSRRGCPAPPSATTASCAWSSPWSTFNLNAAANAARPSGTAAAIAALRGTCSINGTTVEPKVCVKFSNPSRIVQNIQLVKVRVGVSDGRSVKYDSASIIMYNPAVGSTRPSNVPSYCAAV